MYELALFAGVGGGILATKHLLGWRTVCYVEHNKYAVDVLRARIKDGYLDDAPIWDDCFTFDGRPWAGLVDVVSAGFPCQPFSAAGKGLAERDPRNGWPAVIRILREVRPRFAWLENVPALLSKPYFGTIISDLAQAGYDVEWDCISASEVGANHKRERLWILAHPNGKGIWQQSQSGQQSTQTIITADGPSKSLADAHVEGLEINGQFNPQGQAELCGGTGPNEEQVLRHTEQARDRWGVEQPQEREEKRDVDCQQWWQVEPDVGRVADGVAHRMDRLEATGNGQVPAVAARAWQLLRERIG